MLDFNGCRVSGPISHNPAPYGARVIWREGVLYVAHSVTEVESAPCEKPRKWGGGYQAKLEAGLLMIQLPCCTGKRDPALGRIAADQIIVAAGKVDA